MSSGVSVKKERTSRAGTRTMEAAVFAGPKIIQIRRVPMPVPKQGQVRIRLQGCGICASTLPVWEGRPWFDYPRATGNPGHEGWGIIDDIGQGVRFLERGDRVTFLSRNAFAEYVVAMESEVVKLPQRLDDRPFPGEALGSAMNVFDRCNISPNQTVAVVGIGFLGALLVNLISEAGARVFAISRRHSALLQARLMGADNVISMTDPAQIIDRVGKLTSGEGCDHVVEAAGSQAALELAGKLTRSRGRLVIAGHHVDGTRQAGIPLWRRRGLKVINAHVRDPAMHASGIRAAVEATADGRMYPFPLFTHTFKLEELGDAMRMIADRPEGYMKGLLSFE